MYFKNGETQIPEILQSQSAYAIMLIGKRETVTLYVHQSKTQERLLLGFLIVWQLKRTPILDVLTMRITGHYPCTVPLEPKFYVRCLIPVFACFFFISDPA